LIGGVGFTVALFIAELAFTEEVLVEDAKVGVLFASLIAALGGYLFLLLVGREQNESEQNETNHEVP